MNFMLSRVEHENSFKSLRPGQFLWGFDSFCLSRQLWSCWDGQFTKSHFFMCRLDYDVNQFFVHILSKCNWKQPFLNQQEENVHRNYYIINIHISMVQSQDQTRDPSICNRTCYRLPYRDRPGFFSEPSYAFKFEPGHVIDVIVILSLSSYGIRAGSDEPPLLPHNEKLSCDMWFPTMWHFDKCRLRRACAASC